MSEKNQLQVNRRTLIKATATGAAAFSIGAAPMKSLAQDATTITIWTHTHPPMVDQVEAMIATYVDANPDIQVEYEIIPNNNFAERMLTAMSTGTGPDIINMDDAMMRSVYGPNGLVDEVDPVALGFDDLDALRAHYIPTAFAGGEVDGKILGLPSEFNVTALAINNLAFEEVGLDPASPPKTWAEVEEMGQQLVVRDGDNITRRGFDFLYLHAGWYRNQFGTLLLQTGGRLVSEDGTKATINEPEGVAALQIWYDMVHTSQIADPNVSLRESTVPYQDFLDGNMAMTMFNPWGMAFITEDHELYDNYTIAPLPQYDESAPATPLYAYYFAVNSQSEVKEEAFRFVSHLASEPGEWLTNVDFIQPVAGWSESPEAANLNFAEVWAAEMEKGKFLETPPETNRINEIMKTAIESSILNAVPPQEALDQAASEIDAVLGG